MAVKARHFVTFCRQLQSFFRSCFEATNRGNFGILRGGSAACAFFAAYARLHFRQNLCIVNREATKMPFLMEY
jgi:hypothetical protein